MDDETYGAKLAAARRSSTDYKTQPALAAAVGLSPRQIRYYEKGESHADAGMRERFRQLLGDFAQEGDPVEVALATTRLAGWRQRAVMSEYERHLEEQDRQERASS